MINLCVLLLFFVGRALFFLAFVGLPTSFVVLCVFFVCYFLFMYPLFCLYYEM